MNKISQFMVITAALGVNGYLDPWQASRRNPEPNTRSDKTKQDLIAKAEQKRHRRIERNKRQETGK